jgi:antitoxin component YwqK of YwqJK toxin-antitoxin module
MNIKIFITSCLLLLSGLTFGQSDQKLNFTDNTGRKQGHWVKKYPNENLMYEGTFKDGHPVGEMRRYNDDQSLKSILIYSEDGRKAVASVYHPNGFISARGTYIDQKKVGKWQFFSEFLNGYLISEENYTDNKRNGTSVKFYPDSTIAEKLSYKDDVKNGEFTQYYPSRALKLRSYYQNGKLNGKFEVWFENGKIELEGQYKDDYRDGLWLIYKEDGTLKYELKYLAGIPDDGQMEIDESKYIDSLFNNIGKIADPGKTGTY